MKFKMNIVTLLSVLIALIPFGIYSSYYSHMPEVIPIHYNFQGEADRFVSKYNYQVFLILALGFIGLIITKILGKIIVHLYAAEQKDKHKSTKKIMDVTAFFITILFVGISIYFITAI